MKKVFTMSALLLVIGIVVGFLSLIAHSLLCDGRIVLSLDAAHQYVQDKRFWMLYAVIFVAVVGGMVYLVFFTSNRGSIETERIAGSDVPKAAGQNQHGSARWMHVQDFSKYFSSILIEEKDIQVQRLLKKAEREKERTRTNLE